MDVESKFDLIKQVGEEILTEEELKHLLNTKEHPIAYDGFEPSGTDIHIAQGILRAININKMTKAGVKFKMLVADWHAWANNKMSGDLEKIQAVGRYLIEVWKHCGMDLKNVEFVWANDFVKEPEYWKKVMQVARNSTVNRIIRTGQIMGRKEGEMQQASQILYPCMQCADIFHLKADITQLGMDQRKVNVLARELGLSLGFWKPVVVSHHMLMGLNKPPEGVTDPAEKAIAMKMSKSIPDSSIFMTDSAEEVKRKISKAYCPQQIDENPMIEYMRYIIFESFDEIRIDRPSKFGGDIIYRSFNDLAKDFAEGRLHPMDLKNATAHYINELLEPVRKHFSKGKPKELAEFVRKQQVTR